MVTLVNPSWVLNLGIVYHLLLKNSSTISDDVHKAEIFNDFFSSHMRLDDTNPPPLPHFELLCNNKLEVLETSESEVLKLLSKINIHKSSGSIMV